MQLDTLPTPAVGILGKIYQYTGEDDSSNGFYNGRFYKCVYIGELVRYRIKLYFGSYFYVYAEHNAAGPVYDDWGLTSQNGYWDGDSRSGSGNVTGTRQYSIGPLKVLGFDTVGRNPYAWQEVELNDIPTDISDLSDSTGMIPTHLYDLSDVQVGSLADNDVLAWDSQEDKFVNQPQSGGVSDFDDLTNKPEESGTIDMSEIVTPLPTPQTNNYPIGFDESGAEYQVSWYKRASDGKVKPIYRKDIITTTPTAGTWATVYSITNAEEIIIDNCKLKIVDNNITYWNYPNQYSSAADQITMRTTDNSIQCFTFGAFANKDLQIIAIYTKTTDEWREI